MKSKKCPRQSILSEKVLDVYLKSGPVALIQWAPPLISPLPLSSRERTLSRAPERDEFSHFCAVAHVLPTASNALSSLVHLKNLAHPLKLHWDHPPSPP